MIFKLKITMTTFYSKNLFRVLGILALFLLPFSTYAATFTAVTSGDWDSAVTWGGTAPGENIDGNDQIIISTGITVNLNVDVTLDHSLASLNINGELSGQNNLTVNSGTLTGTGELVVNQLIITKDAVVLTLGSITAEVLETTATSLSFSNNLQVNSRLVLKAGTLTVDNNASLNLANDATINLAGGKILLAGNALIKVDGRYNLEFTGNSQSTSVATFSLENINNVILNLDSDASLTLSTPLVFHGTLELVNGNLNLNGFSLIVHGNIDATDSGTIITTGNVGEEIEFTGESTGGHLSFSNETNLVYRLHLNAPNAVVQLNANVSAELVSMTDGDLILNSHSLTISNNIQSSVRASLIGDAHASLTIEGTLSDSHLYFAENAEILASLTIQDNINLDSKLTIEDTLDIQQSYLSITGGELTINGIVKVDTSSEFTGINSVNTGSELPKGNITINGNGNLALVIGKELGSLTMNSAGGELRLDSDVLISDSLNLDRGNIVLTENNLKVAATAAINGGSEESYVQTNGEGELILTLTANGETYEFPIGTEENYCPAIIAQAEGATTTDIKVRADANVLTEGETGVLVNDDVVANTWFISQTDASAEIDLSLEFFWNAQAETSSFNRNNCYISHYENSEWDATAAVEANVQANGYFSVSRTGITSLSPFRVEDATQTSIFNTLEDLEISMYPNPTTDILLVKVPDLAKAKTAKIFSTDGQLVLEQEIINNITNRINLSALTAGQTYYLQVGNTKAKSFVKQ